MTTILFGRSDFLDALDLNIIESVAYFTPPNRFRGSNRFRSVTCLYKTIILCKLYFTALVALLLSNTYLL